MGEVMVILAIISYSIKLNGMKLTKQEFYDILEQYDSKPRKLSELIYYSLTG
jgi:hypothetical protein